MPSLPRQFDGTSPLLDPSGKLKVWLTEPAGMLDQIADNSIFTVTMAKFLIGPATAAMQEIGRRTGVERFRFVHDWRGVKSYEADVRPMIINWGTSLGKKRIAHITILLAKDAGALVRMAVHTGTAAMSVLGVSCDLRDDVDQATVDLRPVAPAPSRA